MIYGLCGEKLSHSYSKIIHNALGNKDYTLCPLSENDFVQLLKEKNFKGINVTIPYKKIAFEMCDVLSDEAKCIGSVNTVVNKNGKLYGYNTDAHGLMFMTQKAEVQIKDKNVLVLGSGGTSLTAKYVMLKMGAKSVNVVSRNGEINYENVYDFSDTDVIINTTPVGMFPKNDESPVDVAKFSRLSGVLDVIYNPNKTQLLKSAEKLGLKTSGGLYMLVYQAVKAHEIFFETKVSLQEVERIYKEVLKTCLNIVLVGMPGSGKSSVGKRVAQILDREFFDTDAQVEKEGVKIPEIFEKFGEETFRAKETNAVKNVCSLSGKVVATGGGAVKKSQNVDFMKSNGIVFLINRDIDKLDSEGRPLSKGGKDAILKLYEERKDLYKNAADFEVSNDDIQECARQIVEIFEEKI